MLSKKNKKSSFIRSVLAIALAVSISAAVLAQGGDLMSQAQTAYDKKEYAKSADLYMQAYKASPKQLLALYNAACSYALDGKSEEALRAMEALASAGYNNPDQVKQDTDFASIKDDARFTAALAKIEENAKKNPPRTWKRPYTVLPVPAGAEGLQDKLGANDAAVWLDGDTLTFLKKSSLKSVQITGGLQSPMSQIAGTDLWIYQVKMADWSTAIVSYAFIEENQRDGIQLKIWRGSNAPTITEASSLKGKVIPLTLHSKALDEDRKVYVYLPPNAPKRDIPVVYLADGGACEQFAKVLEPLILAGKVKPCAIVGVESGGYKGEPGGPYEPSKDMRAAEYVPGQNEDRFKRHMTFVTEEVTAYVAKEYNISTKRADRAVTGFSNGGAFSAAIAFRMPGFFGTSMPLSLGIPPNTPMPKNLPRMFFAAGALESFSASTKIVYNLVKAEPNVVSSYDEYVAGHDPEMWHIAFARLMPKVFPAR